MTKGSIRLSKTLFSCLLTLLVVLSGCGGGGGGEVNDPISESDGQASSVQGVVVDPYIVGAVLQEIGSQGKVLQESTSSDQNGQFSFVNPLAEGSVVQIKAGAQGKHNNAPYGGILKSRAQGRQPLVVSPLTTLVANGMTAEEVVALLQRAGLNGVTVQDVFADPMEGADSTGIPHLQRLQSALAINAFLALHDNYQLGRDGLADNEAQFAEIVEAVRTVVNPEEFQQAEASAQLSTLATDIPKINFGHFLKAAVAITDAVVAKKKANLELNAVEEAGLLLGSLPEVTLFYFAQENRGIKTIEDQIQGGTLPDASPEAVPVIVAGGEVVKNTPPVASAGTGQTVSVTEIVQLDGGGSSDADGDALSYRWSLTAKPTGSQAALSNPSSPTPTFIADEAGSYELTLVVNDGNANSAPGAIVITAIEQNDSNPVQEPAYAAPVLKSVEVNGTSWILQWSQPGNAPEGGYDIFIDGQDSGTANRTTQASINISGLTAGVQHCFQVEARHTQAEPDVFSLSNQVCADPVETLPPPSKPIPSEPIIETDGVYAFPGAEGFGRNAVGGRGGKIYKVTNLNDSGSGSLRAAVEASGPRIIVFEVSGTIDLGSTLNISNPYITIAGQTAPSPGITLKGNSSVGVVISTNDVVLQHLRIRGWSGGSSDVVRISGGEDIIIDHCSMSWAKDDEVFSTINTIKNITVSNSIIAEPFKSYGALVGNYARTFSFVKTLFAHNPSRNPRIDWDADVAMVNNYIYNAGGGIVTIGKREQGDNYITAVGNSTKLGRNSEDGQEFLNNSGMSSGSKVFLKDNRHTYGAETDGSTSKFVVSSPPIAFNNVTQILSSSQVPAYIEVYAGARPADRDTVDARIIRDVQNGTGSYISHEDEVGGFPKLAENTRPFPLPADPSGDDNGNGYTNIEEILYQRAMEVEGRL